MKDPSAMGGTHNMSFETEGGQQILEDTGGKGGGGGGGHKLAWCRGGGKGMKKEGRDILSMRTRSGE